MLLPLTCLRSTVRSTVVARSSLREGDSLLHSYTEPPLGLITPAALCSWSSPACAMLAADLGERLLALCSSKENNHAEVKALLESLTEDQRREVLRSKDNGKVSGS